MPTLGTTHVLGNWYVTRDVTISNLLTSKDLTLTGLATIGGNLALTGDLAISGGDLTSTTAAFNLLNTTVTSLNLAGSATSISMGANSGTLTIGNPTVVGTQVTQNLWNTAATTLNIGGAATTINLGVAGAGTVNINTTTSSSSSITGALVVDGGIGVAGASTFGERVTIVDSNEVTNSSGNMYIYTSDAAAQNYGAQIALGGSYTGTAATKFAVISGRKESTGVDAAGYLSLGTTIAAGGVATEKMRITSDGKVGIGTTTPSAKLMVENGTGRTITSDNIISLQTSTDADTYRFGLKTSFIGGASSTDRTLNLQAGALLTTDGTFSNNGERLSLNPNGGNVGIGLTNPTSKLHLFGTAAASYVAGRIENSGADGAADFDFKNDAVTWKIGTNGSDQFRIRDDTNGLNSIIIETAAPLNSLYIKGTTGNVGLGTASGLAKLSINGGLHVGGDSDPGDNNAQIDGNLIVTGNFTINGTTVTNNSTVMTIDDPIITLGGDTSVAETTKDRGVEARWAGALIAPTYSASSSTTITGTITTTGYAAGDIITISDATPTTLNGTWKIATVAVGSFTFIVDAATTVSGATGTTYRSKNAFFGLDQSTGYFTFIPQGNNTSEIFSGTAGDMQATNFRGALIGNADTATTATYVTNHPTITITSDTTSVASPAVGGTFTAIDGITKDGNGHVTTLNTKTVTLPSDTLMSQALSTAATLHPLLASVVETSDTTGPDVTTGVRNNSIYMQPSTGTVFASILTATGVISTTDVTAGTSTTGALKVTGGIAQTGSYGNYIKGITTHKDYLIIDPTSGSNFNEGIRINGGAGTWRGIFLGGAVDSTQGTDANTWSLLRGNDNNFRITNNSSATIIALYKPTGVDITGDLAVNGGDITTSAAAGTLFNATASTVSIGGAATTINLAAAAGTVNINATTASSAYTNGALVIDGGLGIAGKTFTNNDVTINGTLYATAKSFQINHPTKPNMKLRYGSLEGPENGVYVRGKLDGTNVIELPEYWTALVNSDSITVNLTPIESMQKLYVAEIKDNKVYIENDNKLIHKSIKCFYTVYAERKDIKPLEIEIDNN